MPVDLQRFDVLLERIVNRLLRGRERVFEEIGDDFQARALFHQPCCGAQVAGRGGSVGEAAGILVDAGEHQRGFDAGDGRQSRGERLDEQGGGRAQRLALEAPTHRQNVGRRMVIDHQHVVDFFAHTTHVSEALCIHQDHAADVLPTGEGVRVDKRQSRPVEREERLHVAVDAARQHRARVRV